MPFRRPLKLYAFDVDHTLMVSEGPISFTDLEVLAEQGHIVGLCGNFAAVTLQVPNWQRAVSFLGPMSMTKVAFLLQLKTYLRATDYVMVGNDPLIISPHAPNKVSDDRTAAIGANFRFLTETEFANGAR